MKSVTCIVCIFLTTILHSQIQVNSGGNPTNLVQNILLGNGVSASNIVFSGNANQIGSFTGVNSTIGLNGGIVMSTGNVGDITGQNPSSDLMGGGDADLLTVAQSVTTNPNANSISSTHDAAKLEFDFVPQGDTVSFNFVFASEEYLSYVNTMYNDVFAFFLSGPGITGPYSAPAAFPGGAVNLASVPGSSPALPITISTIYPPNDYDFDGTIDPGFNDQYYIDNPSNSTHGFNGFTTVLSIVFPVSCSETYHFKFAIADCGDGTFDTGVFFEAGSFESEQPIHLAIDTDLGNSQMIEGCVGATMLLTRPENMILDSLIIDYQLSGTAVNGTDYSGIPDTIVFLPGQDTLEFDLSAISDGITEGQEILVFEALLTTPCGSGTFSDTLYILDAPVAAFSGDVSQGCSPVVVSFSNTSGNSTAYTWDFGDGVPLTVNSLSSQTHSFDSTASVQLIASYNGQCPDTMSSIVTVFQNPQVSVNSGTVCSGNSIQLTATGAVNYTWLPSAGLGNITNQTAWANPQTTTSYTVIGTDNNQCTDSAVAVVTVQEVTVLVNGDTICGGNNADVALLIASGASSYIWSPVSGLNVSTGPVVEARPNVSTAYIVTGYSDFGCADTAVAIVVVVPDFQLNVSGGDICPGESVLLQASGAASYTWSPVDHLNASSGANVLATPAVSETYTVTGTNMGCTKTAETTVVVYPEPEAAITASPAELSVSNTEVHLQAGESGNDNSWYYNGQVISQSANFSYTFPGQPGSYRVDLVVENEYGCLDSTYKVFLIKEELIFYVPNAFTPDGDEYNNGFQPVITSGMDMNSYQLLIYNRWGELIFESYDPLTGWDGTYAGALCMNGIYTWQIQFKSQYTDERYVYNGHVQLIR